MVVLASCVAALPLLLLLDDDDDEDDEEPFAEPLAALAATAPINAEHPPGTARHPPAVWLLNSLVCPHKTSTHRTGIRWPSLINHDFSTV